MEASTPAGLLLNGVVEGPLVAVKKGCCGWMEGDQFLKGSQVVSLALLVGSVATILLMSFGIAPSNGQTYLFCSTIILIGGQNAWGLQRIKELGGYERQNAIYAQQNDLLHRKLTVLTNAVNRLDPLVKRFEEANTQLEREVGGFRLENGRLSELLNTQRAQLEEQAKLLEETQAEVEKLREISGVFEGIAAKAAKTTDLHGVYVEEERKLQMKQEQVTRQLEELSKREEGLLDHLSRDVTRLETIIKEKQKRCNTLARRVVPLRIKADRLERTIAFIEERAKELVAAAKEHSKQLRKEQFAKLKAS